nr:MAG TPA: hypothetical protein [Bacteriophage sp.]
MYSLMVEHLRVERIWCNSRMGDHKLTDVH